MAHVAHVGMFGVRSDISVGTASMDEGTNANDEFRVSPSVSQSVLAGGGRYFDLMTPTALLEAEMYPDPKKKYEQSLSEVHSPNLHASQNGITLVHARSRERN